MPPQDLLDRLDRLAGALVLAGPTDLQTLAHVHEGIEYISQWAAKEGNTQFADLTAAMAKRVEAIILEEEPNPAAALENLNGGVSAMQAVLRDGRSIVEAHFPAAFSPAKPGPVSSATSKEPAADATPATLQLSSLVDQKILADFLARQPSVLDEMENLVLMIEKAPDGPELAELRRLVHTLKGEAGLLGMGDVSRLCHIAEDAIDQNGVAPPTDWLLDMKDWLARTMGWYAGKGEAPESVETLLARLGAAPPEVAPIAPAQARPPATRKRTATAPKPLEGDPDLLREFVAEAREHLDNADLHLLTLETEPNHEEALNAVFRAFHTIKGVSGFLSLEDVQALAHEAESLLDRARKGELELSGGYIDLTFDSVDMLKRLVGHVVDALASGEPLQPEADLPMLLSRLESAVMGLAPAAQVKHAFEGIRPDQKVGEILVDTGIVTRDELDEVLRLQLEALPPERLGEILLRNVLVTRSQLDEALERQEAGGGEKLLGEILIEMGAVRTQDLREALRHQEEGREKPKVGELLVQSGLVESRDIAQAIRVQQQRQRAVEVREAVKVDADRLDRLVDLIGELVIAESMVTQSEELNSAASPALARHLSLLDKITRELQEMGTSLRMVPIRATFQKMARLVRDLGKKSGKKVDFSTVGDETEMDKSVVDKIGDPLVHMVRNAVDHGLESSSEERRAVGKPETGHVELRAFHKGGSIYVEVQDDGRGLDKEAIVAKARERGLIRESDVLSEREIYNLIFEPGFSTAKKVTDVSGRGVGMDVVRRNIEALRGQVEIRTERGQGSVFSIRLPLTLAIIDGMVVRVANERYIIPTLSIVRSIQPEPEQVLTVVKRGEMLSLQGELIPLFRLNRLFGIEGAEQDPSKALVVVVEDEGRHAGLLTDELLGQQQIVIKSLGEAMRGISGVSGGAIMPDGRVGLILDVGGLIKITNARGAGDTAALATEEPGP